MEPIILSGLLHRKATQAVLVLLLIDGVVLAGVVLVQLVQIRLCIVAVQVVSGFHHLLVELLHSMQVEVVAGVVVGGPMALLEEMAVEEQGD